MSHKILHLTDSEDRRKLAVLASAVTAVLSPESEEFFLGVGCYLYYGGNCSSVEEPYDRVLRMWADAIGSSQQT